MAARNRAVIALNFLTGMGMDYHPDKCSHKDIGVLISNYFERNGNDESYRSHYKDTGESTRNSEGANSSINTCKQ